MTLREILRRMRMDPGMDPDAALLVLLVQRHGGSAVLSDRVDAEWMLWHVVNGEPTWEGLAQWIATLEANRPPVKRRNRKGVRR